MSTNQNKSPKNKYFMNLALQQAKINLGNTKENPSVGCVIAKGNKLISAGHTGINGRPHAEFNAIKNSKEKLINSNIYVTLEPCIHFGKTPPCVRNIIKNKIKNVYFSIKDPDKRTFGKSIVEFNKYHINTNTGINSNQIGEFYKSYILYKTKKIPFVTCKLAISKDYFTINKKKKWITNNHSRQRVHLLRSYHDVIITSERTVSIDNPKLNCRIDGLDKKSPARIILDKNFKISLRSNVIKNSLKYKTIIFYNKNDKKKIKMLKKLQVKTYKIPLNFSGNFDLKKVLFKAQTLGFSRIFLETGIKLASNFLKENLVNELKIFVSNDKLKNKGEGSFKNYFKTFLKKKKQIIEKVNLYNEKLITYKIK